MSFVHVGEKIFNLIPSAYYDEACDLINDFFPKGCPTIWRHKNLFFDPKIFLKKGIPVHQVMVRAGQMLIIHPRVFHWGWSEGFCVSASVNFCIKEFLPYVRTARRCGCTTYLPYGGFDFDGFLSHHEDALRELNADSPWTVYGEITFDPKIELKGSAEYFMDMSCVRKAQRLVESYIESTKWRDLKEAAQNDV